MRTYLWAFRSGLSCASASSISNPAMPIPSQRKSSYGRRSPTSDSQIAAIHTSSCIARASSMLAMAVAYRRPGPETRVGDCSLGRLRRPFPKESRFEMAWRILCACNFMIQLEWGSEGR